MNWLKKAACSAVVLGMSVSVMCGCGEKETIKDFGTYAQGIEEIVLPEETRIVALGEATHGNKEFQELKLDVFAHLVETTQVRGFALEGDFSGCAMANEYVLYGEGSAQEAVKKLGFEIYRTDEMLELVQWMHDYNAEADEADKVRLYGFDMQRDMFGIQIVKEFYGAVDESKGQEFGKKLDDYYGESERAFDANNLPQMEAFIQEMIADIEGNEAAYQQICGEETYAYALQAAKCLLQNIEIHASGRNYNTIRDKNMTENVKWILNREENIYGTKLMLAGHNGHISKDVCSNYVNMGNHLYKEFGDAYFAIGTDFYNTNCNIASGQGREDYEFCSDDPLAKAVGDLEHNIYYLDFEKASSSTELNNIINNSMPIGSLGENYSSAMKLVKSYYQVNIAPKKLYDGMIFVYEATPIKVWGYE